MGERTATSARGHSHDVDAPRLPSLPSRRRVVATAMRNFCFLFIIIKEEQHPCEGWPVDVHAREKQAAPRVGRARRLQMHVWAKIKRVGQLASRMGHMKKDWNFIFLLLGIDWYYIFFSFLLFCLLSLFFSLSHRFLIFISFVFYFTLFSLFF
jgi:hypothetical protein